MTTATEVVTAFFENDPDCYGDDFILNNGVLYYQSKDWPIAIFKGPDVLINGTYRGMHYQNIIRNLNMAASIRGYKWRYITHEGMKLELEDRVSNPTEFENIKQQLIEERVAHAATKADRDNWKARAIAAEAKVTPPNKPQT